MSCPLETGVISRDEAVTRNQICHQIPGSRQSPPQEVDKCINDNNRGGREMGTIKCYLKTEEQLWSHDHTRKAGKGSGLWGNMMSLVWDLFTTW